MAPCRPRTHTLSLRAGGWCRVAVGSWVSLPGMRVQRAPWTLPSLGFLTFGLQHGAKACAVLHALKSSPEDTHDSHCPAPSETVTVFSSREPGRP